MRRSAMRVGLWMACLGAAWGQTSIWSAGLEIVPGEEQFVFGGRAAEVRVTVRNPDAEAAEAELSWRLYQASSATIAPVSERTALDPIIFPAGREVVLEIPLAAPETRTITSFLVKIWEGEDELGAVKLRVCPEGLWKGVERIAGEIAVYEPEAQLGPLLRGQGLAVTDLAEEKLKGGAGTLVMVRLPSRAAEQEWQSTAADLPESCAVLFLVSPGVTGAELLAPLKRVRKGGREMMLVQEWFVPELEESPLSQLRLLRATELLLKPDSGKFPINER